MSIIVLGASGQLARHLAKVLPGADFWGRDTRDMNDLAGLEQALVEAAPRAIVNAAAWTAVDDAERNPAGAWRLNAEAPAAAARAATQCGATLTHFSTDYVFDGRSPIPYRESERPNPLSIYGASKLAGELAVRALCPRHWVLRTSWVFSEYGTNFVKTVLRLAGAGGPLRIVADQFGQPTWAGDLARLVVAMDVAADSPRLPCGLYHATGGPVVNWHAFAERIVAAAVAGGLLAAPVEVRAITTTEYPTPARRPGYGVLAPSAALGERLGLRFDWQGGLETTLAALRAGTEARTP